MNSLNQIDHIAASNEGNRRSIHDRKTEGAVIPIQLNQYLWVVFVIQQQENGGQIALRGGAYSLTISAVVLAILIAVNVLASALPAALTKYDISAAKLYSVTSNTKVVVNALEKDVTI